tara:strand:- start:520 stop:1224 length:705 start_codon:yes stop_codon:yes gene_type:complete
MYKNKKIACVIPARMSSSRFPGKPLAKIHGRELVLRVADIARKSKHVDVIIIATEDQVIKDLANKNDYLSVITGSHYTCTHRIAEVSKDLKTDFVFGLQGDEPLTDYKDIDKVIEFGIDNDCDMVQPYRKSTQSDHDDPDVCQMIINNGKCLHMQRTPDTITDNLVTHLGLYFYKRSVIADFPNLDMTWVKYWRGLDTIGFIGKYDVIPFELHGKTQAIDRPHHIKIVEQQLEK